MKKIFLISLVVSLCLCALTGIIIFLMGNLGDVEVKILLTTLIIGLYSLSGLCCSTLLGNENEKLRVFSIIGIVLTLTGAAYCLLAVWEIIEIRNDMSWQILLVLIILPIFFAHAALMLLIKNKTKLVQISLILTIIMGAILAAMLLILVYNELDIASDFYFRLLGVVSILTSLGTIVTPILNKIYKEV